MNTLHCFTFTLLAALSLATLACSGEGTTSTGGSFEPNPCASVETWCTDGHAYPWASDDGVPMCGCICDSHDDCTGSPVESHCGVLLRESDKYPSGYEAAFEGGLPRVCRTAETTVP